MPTSQDRFNAENIARDLLIGRGLYGFLFRAGVEFVFWGVEQSLEPLEATVTVGGRWKLDRPGERDIGQWRDLDDAGYVALAEFAGRCRFVEVVTVHVDDAGDLSLTFADGHRLAAEASNEYESWEVDGGPYKVLSMPGRDLAIWTNLDYRSQ